MKEIKTNYFYGVQVSEYGQRNGYVDYRTLASAFDAVLCNDITKLFYGDINGEYGEAAQVNGFIENSEEIEALTEELEEIEEKQRELIWADKEETAEYKALEEAEQEKREAIEELEREQDAQPEIFQYYIISDDGAEILKHWTNEIVYYIPVLDIYVWGVTHYGTAWDYVLTDIKINGSENGEQ